MRTDDGPGALASAHGAGNRFAQQQATSHNAAASSPARSALIHASDWRPFERNTLRGFLSLTLPSGLIIRECTLHKKDDREWIGLPGRPQIDRDGTPRKDPHSGRLLYTNVIEIPDREARERFQAAALAAVHELLGEGVEP